MKKKTIIISVFIFIILLLVPFLIEKAYSKDGQMISSKITMDSYCDKKQDSNSIVSTCIYSGGSLIYKESEGKIIFKRELTENNCFKLSFKDYVISQSQECDINKTIRTEVNIKDIEKYVNKCSPSGRYCIKHSTKGKIKKGGGIGFIVTPSKLYGLEIFEIVDIVENKTIYREAKVRFGGSMKLTADQYWSDNDNFLVFERDKRLYYLSLK